MSRWSDADTRLARARLLAEYAPRFDGDVMAAATWLHEREGWTGGDR